MDTDTMLEPADASPNVSGQHPARRTDAGLAARVEAACVKACEAIAPAWPLDRLIAVNPWWGYVAQPIDEAAAELAADVAANRRPSPGRVPIGNAAASAPEPAAP